MTESQAAKCEWPEGKPFSFFDEPGEHDPCYVVMPDGAMLPFNHSAAPGVDIARAEFVIAACNAALSPKIAAAETGPGDTEARDSDIGILLSALRMHEEATGETFDDCGGMIAQIEADHKARQPMLIAAAIDHLDVKAVAKSQEPEAVAWPNGCDETVPQALRFLADNDRRLGGSDTFNSEHLYQLAGEIEQMASKPLYLRPTTKPEDPAVSVDAITRVEIVQTAFEIFRKKTRGDMTGDELSAFADMSRAIAALITGG